MRERKRLSVIDRETWDRMLEAYKEKPVAKHVELTAKVGRRVAFRAIHEGWPIISLPPFKDIISGKVGARAFMIQKIQKQASQDALTSPTQRDIAKSEAAKQAAEEALAARATMSNAIKIMRMNQAITEKLLEQIDRGDIPIPEDVTPKLLFQLTKSMDTAAAIVQKAIDIERTRIGEPDQVLGIQIGVLLEACSEDELSRVMLTGEIPRRLLDQRPGRGPGEDFSSEDGRVIDVEPVSEESILPEDMLKVTETIPSETALFDKEIASGDVISNQTDYRSTAGNGGPSPSYEADDIDEAALLDALADESLDL